MIYIELFLTFFKFGIISFGGGYTLIPLIEQELEKKNWMTVEKFYDLIGVSEVTPGSISINSATFIGYEVAGIFGSIVATIGMILPSLIIILIISNIIMNKEDTVYYQNVLMYIRPVVAGLILVAAIFVANTSIFINKLSLRTLINLFIEPKNFINMGSLIIFLAIFFLTKKYKFHPILLIIGAGGLGILFFYLYNFIYTILC